MTFHHMNMRRKWLIIRRSSSLIDTWQTNDAALAERWGCINFDFNFVGGVSSISFCGINFIFVGGPTVMAESGAVLNTRGYTGAVLNARGSHWSDAEYATGNWSEGRGARSKT